MFPYRLALVFKIHHTIQWHEDLVLWFLAAAEEANAAGINTYLLLQVISFKSNGCNLQMQKGLEQFL